jgi:hypothetical protein
MPFYWYPYEKPSESSHLVNKAKLQVRGPGPCFDSVHSGGY